MKTFLIVLAVALFTLVGLCAIATCWFILRDGRWAAGIALFVIAVDLTVVVLLPEKPKAVADPDELKRVRTLFRATGPAQTRLRNTLEIPDPHPDTHGEVTRAAYPERTARIRDMQEPMGV